MRRTLCLLSLLAAGLFVAGCGDNGPSVSTAAQSSLTGQYFIHEQVYTYNSEEAAVAAHAGKLGATVERHDGIWARPANHSGSAVKAAKARPASGDLNSAVAEGEMVGSLTLDANGNVTAGTIDFNQPTLTGYYSDNVTGGYALDSNGAGTITLQGSNTSVTFAIALTGTVGTPATNAQILEYERDNAGDVEIGAGEIELQDASAFTQASLSGNYVFGLQGQTCYGCTSTQSGDVTAAGLLALDGTGNITSASTGDFATGFATDNNVALTGTYTAPDSNGRATASLTASGYVNGALPANYVVYVIDSAQLFVLDTDASSTTEAAGLLFGPAGRQNGTFSESSLTGTYVAYEVKEDLANESSSTPDAYADASIALLTASNGTLAGTADANAGGAVSSGIAISYPYTVASNGRVVFSGTEPGGAAAPVLWLQDSGKGYATEQPNASELTEAGLITFVGQTATTTTPGHYSTGTLPAATSQATFVIGAATGTSTTVTGGEGYDAALNGEGSGDSSGTFMLDSSGRGTFTSGSNSALNDGIIFAVSSDELLLLDETSGDVSPTIQLIQH